MGGPTAKASHILKAVYMQKAGRKNKLKKKEKKETKQKEKVAKWALSKLSTLLLT